MGARKPRARSGEVTLRDVAKASGVSIWTASTTFSNPTRVAEPTRQRVLAAAQALDYLGPHPGARSLARGQTGMIAFAAPGDAEALLGDPAAALVARGLLTACDRAGLSLVLTGRPAGETVDGRVFFRAAGGPQPRAPAVVVDGEAPAGVPVVAADVRGAAAGLAALLFDLGHRDLAVLSWPGAEERLMGVAEGWRGPRPLRVYGVGMPGKEEGSMPWVAAGAAWPTPADGEAAARAALARRPRPTALLALSDNLAAGALRAADWMGLAVPGDLSVAGLDDLPGSDALGLTTAFVPYRPLGERAGDLLAALLAGSPAPSLRELPTALTVRRSTGPPPSRPPGG
jgi:DNA-binding LacI/PurR family transcriptional regulator